MIVVDCQQGSEAWYAHRLGIPTASRFDKILTPKTRKYSKASRDYLCELLAEWKTGAPLEAATTDWMERGKLMEPEAVAWYEFQRAMDTEEVGFVLRDDKKVGGSPDRLVGKDGGLEVKCFAPKHHVKCLLGDEDPASLTQVQGYMWLTGRDWWDVLGYHPDLPPVLVRIERDESYISDIASAVDEFVAELERAKQHIEALGSVGRTDSLESLLAASLEVS